MGGNELPVPRLASLEKHFSAAAEPWGCSTGVWSHQPGRLARPPRHAKILRCITLAPSQSPTRPSCPCQGSVLPHLMGGGEVEKPVLEYRSHAVSSLCPPPSHLSRCTGYSPVSSIVRRFFGIITTSCSSRPIFSFQTPGRAWKTRITCWVPDVHGKITFHGFLRNC